MVKVKVDYDIIDGCDYGRQSVKDKVIELDTDSKDLKTLEKLAEEKLSKNLICFMDEAVVNHIEIIN